MQINIKGELSSKYDEIIQSELWTVKIKTKSIYLFDKFGDLKITFNANSDIMHCCVNKEVCAFITNDKFLYIFLLLTGKCVFKDKGYYIDGNLCISNNRLIVQRTVRENSNKRDLVAIDLFDFSKTVLFKDTVMFDIGKYRNLLFFHSVQGGSDCNIINIFNVDTKENTVINLKNRELSETFSATCSYDILSGRFAVIPHPKKFSKAKLLIYDKECSVIKTMFLPRDLYDAPIWFCGGKVLAVIGDSNGIRFFDTETWKELGSFGEKNLQLAMLHLDYESKSCCVCTYTGEDLENINNYIIEFSL